MGGTRRRWRFAIALVLGLIGASLATFAAVRSWFPPDPARLLVRAQAEFQAGRHDRAEALLARVAAIRPPTPMDRMARAQVAWARGRADEALRELAAIPDDAPVAPTAHLLAGRIEVNRGRARDAEAHFRATLARDPDSIQAHRELAYLFNLQQRQRQLDREMDALSRLGALEFDHLLHWSKTRHVNWDPTADCKQLERFVAADPDDLASRLALFDGLMQLGNLDRAGAVLEPLPDDDPQARARRARLALARGDRSGTERLLSGGPTDHPDLARLRGTLALHEGRPAEAARHFRTALDARPDDRALLFALATALRLSGVEDEARLFAEAVRRFDAVTPLIARASRSRWDADPTLADTLGAAIEAAGRPAEAAAWYRLALSRDPLDPLAQQALHRLDSPGRSVATSEPPDAHRRHSPDG